jgi:hypothetical protein
MSQTGEETHEEPVRINPSNEATFRALKNITSKITQCEHHIKLLEDHLIKGTTPKGLTSTIQPSVPYTDTDLIIQWEKIKLDFQSKLILALAEFWKRYKSKLQKEQTKLEKTLKANTVDQEWKMMEEILLKVQMATQERYNKKMGQNPRRDPGDLSKEQSGEGRRRTTRRTGYKKQTTN